MSAFTAFPPLRTPTTSQRDARQSQRNPRPIDFHFQSAHAGSLVSRVFAAALTPYTSIRLQVRGVFVMTLTIAIRENLYEASLSRLQREHGVYTDTKKTCRNDPILRLLLLGNLGRNSEDLGCTWSTQGPPNLYDKVPIGETRPRRQSFRTWIVKAYL